MPDFFGIPFEEVFQIEDIFIHDLRKSVFTDNPTIVPNIDLVFVLSRRSTVLSEDADRTFI